MPKRINNRSILSLGKFAEEPEETKRIVSKPLPSQNEEHPKAEKKLKQKLSTAFNK